MWSSTGPLYTSITSYQTRSRVKLKKTREKNLVELLTAATAVNHVRRMAIPSTQDHRLTHGQQETRDQTWGLSNACLNVSQSNCQYPSTNGMMVFLLNLFSHKAPVAPTNAVPLRCACRTLQVVCWKRDDMVIDKVCTGKLAIMWHSQVVCWRLEVRVLTLFVLSCATCGKGRVCNCVDSPVWLQLD
jgi:hypothetical protein